MPSAQDLRSTPRVGQRFRKPVGDTGVVETKRRTPLGVDLRIWSDRCPFDHLECVGSQIRYLIRVDYILEYVKSVLPEPMQDFSVELAVFAQNKRTSIADRTFAIPPGCAIVPQILRMRVA